MNNLDRFVSKHIYFSFTKHTFYLCIIIKFKPYCVKPLSVLNFSSRAASLLIKARGGLLHLNARCFRNSSLGLYTLCNLDASENTFHFIGVCPIYNAYRLKYFCKRTLTLNDVINILNDTDHYNILYKYLENSLKYRKLIVDEEHIQKNEEDIISPPFLSTNNLVGPSISTTRKTKRIQEINNVIE